MSPHVLSLHIGSHRLSSRSHQILRCPSCDSALSVFCLQALRRLFCVCMLVSLRRLALISFRLCDICRRFSFLHSQAVVPSPVTSAYCVFDVWPRCWFCCALLVIPRQLFSVLSPYPPCRLEGLRWREGYLAAVSGVILALSRGLSRRCCPRVITCHDQGGDLSL